MWYCTVFVGCQVNLTSKIIFHCNLKQNTIIIIQQNAFPSVVSWSLAVLIRLVYVKMLWWFVNPLNDILQEIGFLQIIIILCILADLKVHSTVYLANLWYSTGRRFLMFVADGIACVIAHLAPGEFATQRGVSLLDGTAPSENFESRWNTDWKLLNICENQWWNLAKHAGSFFKKAVK